MDENRLAFIQGKPSPDNDFDMDSIKLTIVDVVSKKVLWTYDGDFGGMSWSPDGKKILYKNLVSRYSTFGVGFQDAPCILFFETDIKRCLRSIPRLVPSGFVLGTTGRYTWGIDNESIFYIYLYYPLSQKEDEKTGNICIYSLKDGSIRCPTQNLPVLHGNSIVHYDISPDQQFMHFCYSDSTILNDYAGNSSDAIINMNGAGFFSWVGNSANTPPSCSDESLWRPLP